jgi:hypothetical protein
MTLKEKFEDIEDLGRYSENGYSAWSTKVLNKQSKECEEIADDYAIEFAEWNSHRYKYLNGKGWFNGSYQLEMDIFLSSKELLAIFKKEKGL